MKYDERTEIFESMRRHGIEIDKSKLGYGLPSKHFTKTAGQTKMLRHYERETVTRYLMHHGVEGQKWGVKHGPPYPLDESMSTGSRLKKRKEREEKRANKFKEKMEKKYTKRRDKLEERIHKNPEKENNWLNTRRKYEVNELNDKLNDLQNMSVATLLNMRYLYYSQSLGGASYGAGYGAGMAMAHSDNFDNTKLKLTLNSFTEDQKKAIAFLMIVLMDELKSKTKEA